MACQNLRNFIKIRFYSQSTLLIYLLWAICRYGIGDFLRAIQVHPCAATLIESHPWSNLIGYTIDKGVWKVQELNTLFEMGACNGLLVLRPYLKSNKKRVCVFVCNFRSAWAEFLNWSPLNQRIIYFSSNFVFITTKLVTMKW